MTRDEIARMRPERAERVREDFIAQLQFQRVRLAQLTSRKEKLIRQLDAQISEISANIEQINSVISEIDKAHFNMFCDLTDEELKKILDDPDVPF